MFKEVVFSVSGGRPRSSHVAYIYGHPELAARMQILHATPNNTWELIEVTGDPDAIKPFREVLARGPDPPMVSLEMVSETPRSLQYVVKWERPKPDEPSFSIEFTLYDTVGPDAIFLMRIENQRVEIKAAGPDGDKLLRFFNVVRQRLESRFQVRLLRVGELRPGWDEVPQYRAGIREEDRELVAFALAAGYYDNPKKCGVRELGIALGCSKSVIARKLRGIERRALESLVRGSAKEAAPVAAPPPALPELRA